MKTRLRASKTAKMYFTLSLGSLLKCTGAQAWGQGGTWARAQAHTQNFRKNTAAHFVIFLQNATSDHFSINPEGGYFEPEPRRGIQAQSPGGEFSAEPLSSPASSQHRWFGNADLLLDKIMFLKKCAEFIVNISVFEHRYVCVPAWAKSKQISL